MSLAREGDKAAFEEVVRRKQSWLRNFMRRLCRDVTLADDLSQQVFLQLWRKIGSLKQADAFDGWLRQIAVNVWLQEVRRIEPTSEVLEETNVSSKPLPGLTLDLNQALATLKPEVRLCVVLAYHEGMTHAEISEHLDLPLGTVKSHIVRGSARLKEVLNAYQA